MKLSLQSIVQVVKNVLGTACLGTHRRMDPHVLCSLLLNPIATLIFLTGLFTSNKYNTEELLLLLVIWSYIQWWVRRIPVQVESRHQKHLHPWQHARHHSGSRSAGTTITANYTQTFTHVGKMGHVTQDQLRQTVLNFSYTFTHEATCSMSLPAASNKTEQCLRLKQHTE